MPRLHFRAATEHDLPVLREIYRRSSLSNEGDRPLLTAHPELLELPADAVRDGRTRVAVLDERVVGFATILVTGSHAELEDLFVDPGSMRLGVGRGLVDDVIASAHAAGVRRVEVDANPQALAFYTRVGFVGIGEAVLEHGTGVRMALETGA